MVFLGLTAVMEEASQLIYFIAAALIIVLDQVTKQAVVRNMDINEMIPVIGNFFSIYSHRNRGAAFGILQDQRWFFIIVTTIVVIGIVWVMIRMLKSANKHTLLMSGLALLLGGAIGNFIDRLLMGEVVDFLRFHFQFSIFGLKVDYIYPIFNVADMGVVIGAGLLILDTLLSGRRQKKEISA